MLEYQFLIRAFTAGILLAVIIPCIGVVVVFKRLSLIGDALSHASLAGVAAGLVLGMDTPVAGSLAACILAALAIETIRRKIPQYAEISIAIVLSAGVGLAGILSGFVSSSASFNSYLFGSIIAITREEIALISGLSVIVILVFFALYWQLFYVALDERAARLAGVPVRLVNGIFTVLTAVAVSVAARTVGALMVTSMMVVPVACAMQTARSYRGMVAQSVLYCVGFTVAGLCLACFVRVGGGSLRPGATIVLTGVCCLAAVIGIVRLCRMIRARALAKGGTTA